MKPLELRRHFTIHRSVEAQLFEEETGIKHAGVDIVIPADHYFATYPGGAIVLHREDFEALFKFTPPTASRCYE